MGSRLIENTTLWIYVYNLLAVLAPCLMCSSCHRPHHTGTFGLFTILSPSAVRVHFRATIMCSTGKSIIITLM